MMQFGPISIVNYQAALQFLHPYGYTSPIGTDFFAGPPSTGYAVFDEAHFFLSDATFNIDMESFLSSFQMNPSTFLQYRWSEFHKKYRDLFYITNDQRLSWNFFACEELSNLHAFYSELLFQIQESKTDAEKLEIYPRKVLEWLGLSQDIQWVGAENIEKAVEGMRNLIEQHRGQGIPESKHEEFFAEFKKYVDTIYCGRKR